MGQCTLPVMMCVHCRPLGTHVPCSLVAQGLGYLPDSLSQWVIGPWKLPIYTQSEDSSGKGFKAAEAKMMKWFNNTLYLCCSVWAQTCSLGLA